MRTPQELLEYIDRMIDVGVDKMEAHSQFALIEMQPAPGKQDESCGKMLVPLVVNPDEHEGKDGHGIQT